MAPTQTPITMAAYSRTLDILTNCEMVSEPILTRKLLDLYNDQMWSERDSGDMQSESAAAIRRGIAQALKEHGYLPRTVSVLPEHVRRHNYDSQ
jgi:hypothetical protein